MPLNQTTTKFFEKLKKQFAASPSKPLDEMTMSEYRKTGTELFASLAIEPSDTPFEIITIPGPDNNEISARVYRENSAELKPGLIFYPGGGFVAELGTHYSPCSWIAKNAGCVVIIPSCRLAPENKYPAGFNDAYAVYQYVLDHHENLGVDKKYVAAGGDSSGGNFAAKVAIKARDENKPLAHQFLISLAVDLSRFITNIPKFSKLKELEKEDLLLQPELATWAYSKYLPNGANPKDPEISPYFHDDLSNLAPATILVGEYDGLRADADGYHEKLIAHGSKSKLHVFSGQTHSFLIARKELNEGEDPVEFIIDDIKSPRDNSRQ